MAVILLHPIGLDPHCWHFTDLDGTVRPTYPGHGGRPFVGPYTLDMLADEVASSTDGPLDLVGVSMGGIIAQHVALRHPQRVRSALIACCSPASHRAAMEERAKQAEQGGMASVLDATLRRWFNADVLSRSPEHPGVAYARRTLLDLPPAAFAAGWRALGGHSLLDRLGDIRARVTCLAGDADVAAPPSVVEQIHGRIPNSRMVVLKGAHMLHLEQPAEFGRIVREHLSWGATA